MDTKFVAEMRIRQDVTILNYKLHIEIDKLTVITDTKNDEY